jgi:hypothetical protein
LSGALLVADPWGEHGGDRPAAPYSRASQNKRRESSGWEMKRGEGDASAASRKERKKKRPAAVAWERRDE